MLKRSPGPKVRGGLAPPSGCRRDLFSLILSLSTVTPPGRWNSKEVLCYEKKKEHLTGLCKNSEAWTQATWLKSPFWFKQSLANFSSGLDAVVFIHWLRVVLQLLAGNCLPYHQPNCPSTDKPTKVLEPARFLLTFRGRRFCLHAFLGATLVHSQLHQIHLMQASWFNGAHPVECKQTANIQPFFQSRPMPKSFLGVKVHW